MSKVIIYFPTNADVNALMEKSLRGGMSVVNTRVGFDSNIFIKDKQQKLCDKIRNKETDEIESKRVSTFILKMDENNQDGNAMTKPVPIGCIKKEAYTPNIRELLLLLSRICHKDGMGHLCVVDLEFNVQKATEKQIFFAEQKVVPARNRSAFQMFDAIRLRQNDVLNNYKCTAKAHSTMDKKILNSALRRTFKIFASSWTVTKIHNHFTFRQEMFKKDFVIGNQIARQNAKTPMEKNVYKLMNNSNFSYDCCNNFENCYFTLVVDEIEEMT